MTISPAELAAADQEWAGLIEVLNNLVDDIRRTNATDPKIRAMGPIDRMWELALLLNRRAGGSRQLLAGGYALALLHIANQPEPGPVVAP